MKWLRQLWEGIQDSLGRWVMLKLVLLKAQGVVLKTWRKNIWKREKLIAAHCFKVFFHLPLNLVICKSTLKIHEWNILSYPCCWHSSCFTPQVKLYFPAKFKPICIISLHFLCCQNLRNLINVKKVILMVGLLTLPLPKSFSPMNLFWRKYICVFVLIREFHLVFAWHDIHVTIVEKLFWVPVLFKW